MTEFLKWLLSPNSLILPGIPTLVLVLMATSLGVSTLGWIKPEYFFSLGYRLSLAAQMFLTALVWDGPFWGRMTALVLLGYGLWPGTKFSFRDKGDWRENKHRSSFFSSRIFLWPATSVLWVLLVMPVVFHLHGGAKADGGWISAAGTWVALIGVFLDIGSGIAAVPYRIPGLLGFILVWTGVWLGALPFYQGGFWRWGLVALGPLTLLFLFLPWKALAGKHLRKGME